MATWLRQLNASAQLFRHEGSAQTLEGVLVDRLLGGRSGESKKKKEQYCSKAAVYSCRHLLWVRRRYNGVEGSRISGSGSD
jgi:hypothetical protein